MKDIVDNKFSFHMDLMDHEDNIWGIVSVVPLKEMGKRDILLSDAHNGNYSFRSITELLNMLLKKNVSFEDRKRVLEFLAESLLFLEKNDL
jgi:hypothetical protein